MATIRIENKANIEIDNNHLTRIVTEATLPPGELILVFNDAPLPDSNQGTCVPRALLSFSRSYATICRGQSISNWDVCIAISDRYCGLQAQYPAYFTYLIGHELGHAKICLLDIALHIHYCLIQDHIKGASHNEIAQWYELPHERCFDRFGIYLCEKLYSRSQLNLEIERLIANPDCKDHERLHMMLSLDASDVLDHLREEIIRFSLPFKSALILSWKKERQHLGDNSLTSLIADYEALFE